MSRSSGRNKVKKPKYTQEAADFDKYIKNECFGDSSIREIKKCLEKLLRLFSAKEEISARLPPGLQFLDAISYELQDLLASDKNKNRKLREFALHTLLFHSCDVVKFKIMNINLESQFNEPIDELSISVEDYLTLVRTLRLQEHALHCLKQLKTEDKLLIMKEFVKASMTTDLIANALSVDAPSEIINFIIEHIKDEPILWSVLNFVEDILKHVTESEKRSRDGRIPLITRYNKIDYRQELIEYQVSRDYLMSLIPRIVALLQHFQPDLLPLSDSIGTMLHSIREKLAKDHNRSLVDTIESLMTSFTERQKLKDSLRGRVGGHISKMIDNSPYSLENKLLRLITESRSTNESSKKTALNALLEDIFMNDEAWLKAIEENEKDYINELAVNMTRFIVANFSNMNERLQSKFRTMIVNMLMGSSNMEYKENMIATILNNAKNSDKGLITIIGSDNEIKSKFESELVPLFNLLVPQSFEDKNLIASVYKYCAAIPSQFVAKIIDEAIKHKGQAELLLQLLQLAKCAAKFILPDGTPLLVQEITARMNDNKVIQHQQHATNFINFITLILTNQSEAVLDINRLFYLLSNTIRMNMTNTNDTSLVFDLKILNAFITADATKDWMNTSAVWSVLSDLTKLLDLYRNKHIGIQQLLGNDEDTSETNTKSLNNKKLFNYNLVESVIQCLDYITTNLTPTQDMNSVIEQYLSECESISTYNIMILIVLQRYWSASTRSIADPSNDFIQHINDVFIAWITRLTQFDLFESIKQRCASLSQRVDRLNYSSETQQQQPQHPVEVIKNLIDMLLAAISSPVYSDLFIMLMKAKRSADEALAEEDDEDDIELTSPDINLTSALSSGDMTAMDYLQPTLFPQYLFLASIHVIPYCMPKELLSIHYLFVQLMEKDLLQFRSDLFRSTLGDDIKDEDIDFEVLSICFISRIVIALSDEEASANTAHSIDFAHVIKTFVTLAECIKKCLKGPRAYAICQLLVVCYSALQLLQDQGGDQLYILVLHLLEAAKSIKLDSAHSRFVNEVASKMSARN